LTKQLEDPEHYLILDEHFSGLLFEIKCTRPGRQRNKILELFWMKIYNGCHMNEMGALRARSFALNDFLSTFDELYELSVPPEDQDQSRGGIPLGSAGVARPQEWAFSRSIRTGTMFSPN
jgi:hypothetical protein